MCPGEGWNVGQKLSSRPVFLKVCRAGLVGQDASSCLGQMPHRQRACEAGRCYFWQEDMWRGVAFEGHVRSSHLFRVRIFCAWVLRQWNSGNVAARNALMRQFMDGLQVPGGTERFRLHRSVSFLGDVWESFKVTRPAVRTWSPWRPS